MFTARGAVNNESTGKSDGEAGKSDGDKGKSDGEAGKVTETKEKTWLSAKSFTASSHSRVRISSLLRAHLITYRRAAVSLPPCRGKFTVAPR